MTNIEGKRILAVITTQPDLVSGGAPIFIGSDESECVKIAGSLSRILDAMAHQLENGTLIIVSH